jgi:biotin transport system permease protein
MADLVVFRYVHRHSALHHLDGRIKLACMALFGVSANLASTPVDFAILTLVLFAALLWARLPIAALVGELRYFSLIIVPVILVQAFTTPGVPISGLPLAAITAEGLRSGLLFSWRLVVVIVSCVILTGTTPLSQLGSAVEWFLRPIPFIPATRIATMINLTFVFVPLVFDQAAEMRAAQKARCIDARRNPIKRLAFVAFPLLVRAFMRADEMVLAMEARCYSEERTRAVFGTNRVDWLVLVASILVGSIVLLNTF